MWFRAPEIDALVTLALREDIGTGDLSTEAAVEPSQRGRAHVRAKSFGIMAGGPLLAEVFRRVDPDVVVLLEAEEGQPLEPGDVAASLRGRVAAILTAERTALNFLGRLCGIASLTATFVEALKGTAARVTDTRKTLPGFRALDKYAVRVGGGTNHRSALDAGILLKENHVEAAGGVDVAILAARARSPHLLRVEVEVETLAALDAALEAGADAVLLDNFDLDGLRACVTKARAFDAAHGRRTLLEASGNMTLDRVRAVAETGVDLISVGALTHSVCAFDVSLRLEGAETPDQPD